ncbi:hypothetical protein [Flavobacterium sp. AJR]|uniref:hypothetical protein n=1 Tax=Flavobacterium sp. AJR TaxID=1979369 RepID=UPI000A3D695A|nr:hypothetical protein [Flavobacterium sp. AJR]OUL63584.1 hypothetical protein B8T70_04540 [Flavobacterium sp. AJR]
MKNLIYLISCVILLSCNKKDNLNDTNSLKIANQYLTEYYKTKNQKFLEKSYKSLNENTVYKEEGITNDNKELVLPLLMYMKKYDELEKLLQEDTILDKYQKEITSNLIKSLNNQKDMELSKKYIYKNIDLIQNKITSTPNDSLLYTQYFIMKLYLNGRDKTLQEIDSMKAKNPKYSKAYYDYILRDLIEEYPQELLYK